MFITPRQIWDACIVMQQLVMTHYLWSDTLCHYILIGMLVVIVCGAMLYTEAFTLVSVFIMLMVKHVSIQQQE